MRLVDGASSLGSETEPGVPHCGTERVWGPV